MSASGLHPERVGSGVKIAFVIQTFHPIVGGAERQLLGVLPLLQQRGIEALVITRGLAGEPSRDTIDGIRVVRCGHYRRGALGSLGFFFGAFWHLLRFRPVMTHAFSLMTPATVTGLYRALKGAPMVLKALGGGVHGDCQRITEKPLYATRRRWLLKSIDAAQVISDEIDAELAQLGVIPERRFKIPNGVDVARLSAPRMTSDCRTRVRTTLSISDTATVFVYVGRLVPGKWVDGLIESFQQAFAESGTAWLLVAGDGPQRAELEQLAGENPQVKMLGACDDIPELLAAADVFVLPSSAEGMSNALLEAMAAGMPVVSTDVGAAGELLGGGERGVLIPPADKPALIAALRAIDQDTGREAMGLRAREYVELHHGMGVVADSLMSIYQQLLTNEAPLGDQGIGEPSDPR